MNNVNKECMEKILQRLTALLCMLEYNDIKNIQKFVDMSTSVSAQLLAIDEMESNTEYDDEDWETE